MNIFNIRPLFCAITVALVFLLSGVAAAQSPVETGDDIAGFIHFDQAGRQVTRAVQILNSIGGNVDEGDLKAVFTRKIGDPNQVLLPIDGSLTLVWLDVGKGNLLQVSLMSQYPLTPYMTDCLKSVGLIGEVIDDDVVLIFPQEALKQMRNKRKALVDLHRAVHPSAFSMTLKEPLLRELTAFFASRLKRMGHYGIGDIVEALQPPLPPLALEPLGDEADTLLEQNAVDRALASGDQQFLAGINAVLSQSRVLHFNIHLFSDTFQPRLTLELKPESPMYAFSQKTLLPAPALVRYLPDDTAMRFSFSVPAGDMEPLLRPVFEGIANTASQSNDASAFSGILQNIDKMQGARGPLVGALNPFIVAHNNEVVLVGTDFSAQAVEHLGRLFLGVSKKGISFKSDAEKLERHPVDHFVEGGSETPSLFVMRPAEYVVFARPKRSLYDASDRLLRVKPLTTPLLSQQKMLPGMLLYVDYRPVGSIKKDWQDSPYMLFGVRMEEGVMQFLGFCPASSLVPVVAELSVQ
jgi:hypothetical protein